MRAIAIVAVIVVTASLALAQEPADREDRVILEVIQLKYLDVQTAMAIFGGTVIGQPSYMPSGPRGGYGSYTGGYGYPGTGYGTSGGYTNPRHYGYGAQSGYGTLPNLSSPNQNPTFGYSYFR